MLIWLWYGLLVRVFVSVLYIVITTLEISSTVAGGGEFPGPTPIVGAGKLEPGLQRYERGCLQNAREIRNSLFGDTRSSLMVQFGCVVDMLSEGLLGSHMVETQIGVVIKGQGDWVRG
ncbi:uncharacterized protein EI90DRAFT_3291523 [Cantharellus anzutake]|uniref:uncharacterized protein n=1 Tax=Cantharellus anzutake TaxID=1750568 RepID=UPI001906E3E7|nr:uncharacterized protein EI90DRAFT_3291523 [Cantharellus anzutake]KAF8326053.1 hypothetical protein EI90DRAFT_3291523 [Cantharellus anzutake]